MREDPPPEARCRDKFLVQSIAITPEREMPNVAAIVSHPLIIRYSALTIISGRMLRKFQKMIFKNVKFELYSFQATARGQLSMLTER